MRNIWLGMMVIALMACSSDKDKGGGGGGSRAPADDGGEEDGTEDGKEAPDVVVGNDGKLRFLAPNTNDQIVLDGETYEVHVEFGDVAPTARWGLYYTANKDSFLGGVAIIEDLPINTSGVPWDVNFVEPGTYYMYGMLTDSNVTTVHFAPGSFKIEGEATGNHAPMVSLTLAPPPGNNVPEEIYAPGTDVAITFTGSDKDDDEFTFKIEYTVDGSTWATIAEDIAQDQNQYIWSIPADATVSARYQVRITADDGVNSTTAMTPEPFGVTEASYTFQTDMLPVFSDKCAFSGCHVVGTLEKPDADLDLSSYGPVTCGNDTCSGASAKIEAIVTRTRVGGGMPQAGNPDLTAAERDLIQFWVWQGAPNN